MCRVQIRTGRDIALTLKQIICYEKVAEFFNNNNVFRDFG
jgi:hypothetical protein